MSSVERWGVVALICLASSLAESRRAVADEPAAEAEFFERKVRPLLIEKCFACHGQGRKKGKLSLDSREGMLTGGESGQAVVPGKPEESLLLEAIGYQGDIQMPPDGKLSDAQIAVFKQWIALGLPWPAHSAAPSGSIRSLGTVTDEDRRFWSFQSVHEPQRPNVNRADWPRQPLDTFVLAQLEQEKIEPVGEADRRTLIRRSTFDLLGLPPTAEEIEAFVNDQRPDAYEQVIERLLASPHYGERWARHWLDVARYGEDQAHTFQARLYPGGFHYRDWVIKALNDDMPYDRFVVEQIAGDLLTEGDAKERLPALGYFALGPVYYGDGGCGPRSRADEHDDRIDTLCRGMLGLTVSCARCHDHKFDPIPTQDYYALVGVFASTKYAELPLAPPEVVKLYDDAQAHVKDAEQAIKDEQGQQARRLGESLAAQTEKYLLACWRLQNRRKVESEAKVSVAIEGTDLDETLVQRWLKYLGSDEARKRDAFGPWWQVIAQQDAKVDLSADPAAAAAIGPAAKQVESTLLAAIDARRQADARYREQLAALPAGEKAPEKPQLPADSAVLVKELIDGGNAPLALPKDRVEKSLSEDDKKTLAGLRTRVEDLQKALPQKYPVAHGLAEGSVANARVNIRGNPVELGDEVPRHFLSVLSPPGAPPFGQGSGRLELARAIASRDNPLTARVLVNRVWQHHFGRGIVGSPSNFGILGERPTHPELLDHLAAQFMDGGWSIKKLHRSIMLSSTYRLASTWNAANHDRDPDNRLLWRANRRRLDVESWRDALLAVSGNLDRTLGGPSADLKDSGNRRRTLYGAVSRHDLNPLLRLFDFPDPNLTSERRVPTTVPMQQLFVLNSEFMIRQSKALADRLQHENISDDEAKIDRLYHWVFGRAASEPQRRLGREFLAAPLPEGTSAADIKLTRWEQYAQALLSSNEFVFVD